VDRIQERIDNFSQRLRSAQEQKLYFYLQDVERLDGAYVYIRGKRMLMLASYSYLGLIGHPRLLKQLLKQRRSMEQGLMVLEFWQEPSPSIISLRRLLLALKGQKRLLSTPLVMSLIFPQFPLWWVEMM